MVILYSLVARDGIVLGEFTTKTGNFQAVTRLLLPRVPRTTSRMSYVYDENIFHHYFSPEGYCYLAMCPRCTNFSVPYLFLQDIAERVERRIPQKTLRQAIALSLNSTLAPLLQQRMEHWNRLLEKGTTSYELAKLEAQISEIHDVMVDNIDKLLARREKINLLVDRTGELCQDAVEFRRQARRYHRHVWWKEKRCVILFATVITVILLGVSMFFCGGPMYPECRARRKPVVLLS